MEIGDLVKHKTHEGHMGIVIKQTNREIFVAWHDGEVSWAYKSQMEVIS